MKIISRAASVRLELPHIPKIINTLQRAIANLFGVLRMGLRQNVNHDRLLQLFAVLALVGMIGASPATAVAAQHAQTPDVSNLLVPGDVSVFVDPELSQTTGPIQVVVQLTTAPLAVAYGVNAKQLGGKLSPSQERDYLHQLANSQDTVMSQIRSLGGQELGRLSKVLDALIINIDSSQVNALASLPNVASIRPVQTYQIELSDVVPYIGATAVHNLGFDGTGVRVAVLDSGIDYTHADLGGPGTAAAYTAAYGTSVDDPRNKNTDGLFPTAKVIGGFDFVGDRWPGPDPACGVDSHGNPLVCLRPDPDPIDCGPSTIPPPCAGGHGTHTSSIIGGAGSVAPGVSLYAVKVCSAVSTSCSGVALLQGMEFALDPNGDGNISDAVDVINMSLGSSYGQKEDDLSAASANAVNLGVVVVSSAGNSADRPYIVGSPSTTPEVISVAATFHPTAKMYLVQTPTVAPVGAVWQSWSAAPSLVSGPLVYDTTSASTRRGCTNAAGASPWTGTPFLGKILLIDRGLCAVSMKVANAGAAGAIAAIVANNAAQGPCDLPPTFSFGGGTQTIAGYTITLADGNTLKASALGQTATINPANAINLVGNMAAFSSRGPSYSYNSIKPDIGAVGTDIISAEAGTATGRTPFAGTSASAPVVTGTVALLVDAFPARTPSEIKQMLMNTADTNIGLNPAKCPGVGAPISRIGSGEVRVDRAVNTKTTAWDNAAPIAVSLSFGYQALTSSAQFVKTVAVHNYGSTTRTYSIAPTFRYPADAASGAVTISAPSTVKVAAGATATFKVKLAVDVTRLPVWDLNGGSRGGDGFRLDGFEFDGYINISDNTDNVHLAWQILPHRAAAVTTSADALTLSGGTGTVQLTNPSSLNGRVELFSLTGSSGKMPQSMLPQAGDNRAVIDLRSVGVRLVTAGGQPGVQFAVTTFGIRSHPNYPAEFDILIDTNHDGTDDFAIFNLENGGFAATGQNVVAAGPLPNGPFTVRFFTDADLDSGNVILTALLSDIGLTPSTQFRFSVLAVDNYFTGAVTDAIVGMTYTLNTPRYVGSGIPTTGVPAGGSSTLTINSVAGGAAASPSQNGLLLWYRDALPDHEKDSVLVTSG